MLCAINGCHPCQYQTRGLDLPLTSSMADVKDTRSL